MVVVYQANTVAIREGQSNQILIGGAYIGKMLFCSVPPSDSIESQCWTIEGIFELTRRPSKTLNLNT